MHDTGYELSEYQLFMQAEDSADSVSDHRSIVAKHPWLAVSAGVGAGLLIGALLPRAVGGKLGQRAKGLAVVAGELGLALATGARTKAGETGLSLAREALRLTGKARK